LSASEGGFHLDLPCGLLYYWLCIITGVGRYLGLEEGGGEYWAVSTFLE
jgi:hypothetical protein